jgi:MoaA/NifB/PqqE/SkfB family radical SAM enzyme
MGIDSSLQMIASLKGEIKHYRKRERGYWTLHPANLLLFVTYRCTSRCKTCTMWQRPVTDSELTLKEWQRLIDDAAPYGIDNVELFGGDALLRKDVTVPLAGYISQKGIQPDLSTNCNLLDSETV